eukprot:COSAG01_NODE_4630_length_4863_cov_3.556255_5_plen_178_part_00
MRGSTARRASGGHRVRGVPHGGEACQPCRPRPVRCIAALRCPRRPAAATEGCRPSAGASGCAARAHPSGLLLPTVEKVHHADDQRPDSQCLRHGQLAGSHRIWCGWDIPWWGLVHGEEARQLRLLALASLLAACLPSAAPSRPAAAAPQVAHRDRCPSSELLSSASAAGTGTAVGSQ